MVFLDSGLIAGFKTEIDAQFLNKTKALSIPLSLYLSLPILISTRVSYHRTAAVTHPMAAACPAPSVSVLATILLYDTAVDQPQLLPPLLP